MKFNQIKKPILGLILGLSISYCASSDKKAEDPLKNTKKLVIEGHSSLYYQGALPVKGTSIKFIPPMEEASITVLGRRYDFAAEQFSKSMIKASESVVVVKNGTKMSWKTAGNINDKGEQVQKYLSENATKPGLFIMYASVAESYGIIGSSFDRGKQSHEAVIAKSAEIRKEWDEWAEMQLNREMPKDTSPSAKKRFQKYQENFQKDFESTVYGYIDLDEALKNSWNESYEDFRKGGFLSRTSEINEIRSAVSESIFGSWKETIFQYGKDTKEELGKAKGEIEAIADKDEGIPTALLKSFSRATKAILYDSIIKPISKFALLSVGYVTWNGLIYPVALGTNAAGTTMYGLVETITLTGKGVVYLTAPSIELVLGSIINSTEVVVHESVQSLDKGAKVTSAMSRKSSAYSVKSAAFVTESSGKYILAPMSYVGVTAGQTVLGGGLAVTGTVAGGAVAGASGTTEVVTYASTKATSATVGVVGSAASFGVGTFYGVYQVGKAIGVPSGVAVGTGIVLSYEFMAQISAHSILAAADCTYLVLSLEGGKWVVYGVKDNSKKAARLLSGAVVDLDQVRKEGGTIVKVPMEPGEVEKILGKKKKK
ncbi:hypothetical protein [Leptospira limi]|uniref:Uncharacterized protein n=1 Tax=Leptospira limi TaxID=2950023 RepID=A0ABT3LZL1_9LEPT|nr:hypothetical protein [Leptospira limi]MCW7463162.1 hypothetical protein [Leptospira limi]